MFIEIVTYMKKLKSMLLTFPVHNCWQSGGSPLALQQGVWSKPFVRQPNVSVAQGAHIIKSVISAVSASAGSHSLVTHVLCPIPLLAQQLLISGSFGASPTVVGFILPGVKVKLRTAYEGKLEPCEFKAYTVTSYIVKGTKLLTVVSFRFAETVTWTVCDVVDLLVLVSLGSIRCSSNILNEVTFIPYSVIVSTFEVGKVHEIFRDFSVRASTSTFSGALGRSSEINYVYA